MSAQGVSAHGVSVQGVSAHGGVCPGVCLPRGVSEQGGVYLGGSDWGCLPEPPVDRIRDACENITLQQLLFRTVINNRYRAYTEIRRT